MTLTWSVADVHDDDQLRDRLREHLTKARAAAADNEFIALPVAERLHSQL
jgi:hypothetical protein